MQPLLVGRSEELRRAHERAARGGPVVLVGLPGVGKTAVALAAFERPTLCSMAGAVTADEGLERLCDALGLWVAPPVRWAAVVHRLEVHEAPLLIDAADGLERAFWDDLWDPLRGSRAATVITARTPITRPDVGAIEVAPLSVDDGMLLWQQLAEQHGFESQRASARRIAELLDGLPQALVWFASRAALLGESASLARLVAGAGVDGALRTSLDASIESLSPAATELLELACCFERGMPSAVLAAVPAADAAPDLLRVGLAVLERGDGERSEGRLVARNLVKARVVQGLTERGVMTARAREHATRILALAEAASDERTSGCGPHPSAFSERFELFAIAERFRQSDAGLALRACVVLATVADQTPLFETSAGWMAELAAEHGALEAPIAIALSVFARRRGQLDRAREVLDRAATSDGLVELERAQIERLAGRAPDAARRAERVLERAQELADDVLSCIAAGELGRMWQSAGQPGRAKPMHELSVALAHAAGLEAREALERSLHARATHRAGNAKEAIGLHELAYERHRDLGQTRLIAAEAGHLAYCHHEVGALAEAQRRYREAVDGLHRAGDVVLESIDRILLARLLADRGKLAEARLELALAGSLSRHQPLARVEDLRRFVLAVVALLAEAPDEADEVLGEIHHVDPAWERATSAIEIGFEPLVVPYAALARRRAGRAGADALLAAGAAARDRLPHEGLRLAWDVLSAHVRGEAPPEVPAEALSQSAELRRAMRWQSGVRRCLSLTRDGSLVRLPDGEAVEFGRRAAPRRLLVALARHRERDPGSALSHEALIDAGWPGERILAEASRKRLRTAIWTLRRLGFEPLLITRQEGYLLDPEVAIAWDDTTPRSTA